jgi:hypothetical protein
MRYLYKMALFWLLLVTLPTQGFAAVSMLFCESTHHATTASSAMTHGHHHDAARAADDPADMTATHHHGQATSHDSGHRPACGGCMSCCVGVLMTPSLPELSAFLTSDVQPAFFAMPGRLAPDTDGPYRPPRRILA